MTQPEPQKEGVNRSRRSNFIFRVVGYSLATATVMTAVAGLGYFVAAEALVEELVTGLVGLAGIATIAYVGGSSVDYNGGVANMFTRKSSPPKDGKEEAKG